MVRLLHLMGCCVCVEVEPLCTSYSGIEIYESGEWANPNDPCDFGFCGDDGFFSGVIIDCPEQMGMPCDGEWVLEDGACCSTCVENTDSDCGSISITLNNGWNMIGFACSENTNALGCFCCHTRQNCYCQRRCWKCIFTRLGF